jgi:hypothetical protein
MKSQKLTFNWNLPYDFDPLETEIKISYFYTPGDKSYYMAKYDPEWAYAPVIEEVEIKDLDGEILNNLPDWVLSDLEEACWNNVEELGRNFPKSKEDLC